MNILPQLLVTNIQIRSITPDAVNMIISVNLNNPSIVAVHLDSLQYSIYMGSRRIAESRYDEALDIKANDSSAVLFPIRFKKNSFIKVTDSLEALYADSTDYHMDVAFYIDLPLLRNKQHHISLTEHLPVLYLPEIRITDMKLTKAGIKNTSLQLTVEIFNKADINCQFSDVHYSMAIEGSDVFNGHTPLLVLKAGDTTKAKLQFDVKTNEVAGLLPEVLFNKAGTGYNLYADMYLQTEDSISDNSRITIESKGSLQELKNLKKE